MTKARLGWVMLFGMVAAGCDLDPAPPSRTDYVDQSAPRSICGNGVLEAGEACDTTVPAETTCGALGFDGGTVSCSLDCLEVRVDNCAVAPRTLTATPDLAIEEDTYDGTIASMNCVDFLVPEDARGIVEESDWSLTLGIDHAFVGDLVVKLVAPSGHVGTLVHRPGIYKGPDDGSNEGGYASDLVATHPITLERGIGGFDTNSIGANLTTSQAACRDNPYCRYVAQADAGEFEIEHERVGGTWRVCFGDAADPYVGVVKSIALTLEPTVHGLPEVGGGEPLFSTIPDGTFDGTTATMACRAYDFSGLDPELTVHDVRAAFHVTHPNPGDLVYALVDPVGELHSLGVRAGVAEDASGHGDGPGVIANLTNTDRLWFFVGPYAGADPQRYETFSLALDTDADYCEGTECHVRATSGALPWLDAEALIGTTARGTYTLCVGDAVPGDAGVFTYGIVSVGFDP